jgi:hypothetical protein
MAGREAVECIAGVGPHGDAAGTEVVWRELPSSSPCRWRWAW